jgi:hypothetical protein
VGEPATLTVEAPAGPASADPNLEGPTGTGSRPPETGRRPPVDLSRAIGRVLALLGFVIGARVIVDNSFLTHLATGRLILERGAVPTADPYSALASGLPWTVQSWLVSVIYAWLDATAGGWSIRVFHGALGAGITLGLWQLVAPSRQLVTRVWLTGLTLLTGTALWAPRPLLVGLAAAVVTLQVVQAMRPRWWLVPLFALWVNCHGSFALGLALLAAVAVGAAVDRRRWPRAEIGLGLRAALGCGLGALNPQGWRLLWFPVELLRRGDALRHVAEWRAPDFRSVPEQLFLALLALIVVAASRRCPWRQLVPGLVFFASGLLAVRNLGMASLVIVALMAPSLAGLGGRIDGAGPSRISRPLAAAAAVGFLVVSLVVALEPAIELSDYPVAEVDWLDTRSLVATEGVSLGHREVVGNYLTLRYGEQARVFMDDRFDFYPLDVITDHNELVLGGDLDGVLSRRGFDVVLWSAESPLGRWLEHDEGWDVVHHDGNWLIACRRSSPVYGRCRS